MNNQPLPPDGFDRSAAITRSLLGYGVIAGPIYLVVGVILGIVRDGFDFSQHALSLLMLGDFGWIQKLNIIVVGLMVIAAATGFARALRGSRIASWAARLVGGYGACLIASGIFPPDPMAGFPDESSSEDGTVSGVLHLAFGAIGFLVLAIAAIMIARWCTGRGETRLALYSRLSALVIVAGFLAGAALATETPGVLALWIAVVAGWAWLATTSIHLYRTIPHPDAHRRRAAA
ncbi:DUF998 domain-containing protein [Actinobacteria bacterium YIM 96077]|uniref:DUF998 domain-containing protein n=1 Tax=Phytoactinopolyspora halophila TaxID=1981511 RepID=A0A329QJ85_9ACTN|nr:DUF998 domain-containing protein [Phytoactinopolyspora halophila]AYY12600.1 DUF998 domain-containing protein [Actinobacteria bacterium YIM 96077]RAW12497.1 DUF998 domain-containing protein [Phytoactinopolyspora halophila]